MKLKKQRYSCADLGLGKEEWRENPFYHQDDALYWQDKKPKFNYLGEDTAEIASAIFDLIRNSNSMVNDGVLDDNVAFLAEDILDYVKSLSSPVVEDLKRMNEAMRQVKEDADKRVAELLEQGMDNAVKEAIARRLADLDKREAAVAVAEDTWRDVQEKILDEEAKAKTHLAILKDGVDMAKTELKAVQKEWETLRVSIAAEKEKHAFNVSRLRQLIDRYEACVKEYGELDSFAGEFVDKSLMVYFENGSESQ
jgi:chromosome segregation ATPase